MKMGKRNGKKKRRRNFQLAGPGGNFGPPGRERARGGVLAAQLAQLRGSDGGGRRRGAGLHAREREGADSVDGNGGRGVSTGVRPAANPAAVLRRWSGPSAGKQWRSTGGCRGSWGWG
jgi:hypothetical protein